MNKFTPCIPNPAYPPPPPGQHQHACLANGPANWHFWSHPTTPLCEMGGDKTNNAGPGHPIYLECPQHDGLPFHERL